MIGILKTFSNNNSMRYNIFIIMFLVSLCWCCIKQEDKTPDNSQIIVSASRDASTKTSFMLSDRVLKVAWKEGDQIGISVNGGEFMTFTQCGEISEDGHRTTFSASGINIPDGGPVIAVYPYSSTSSLTLTSQSGKIEDLGEVDVLWAESEVIDGTIQDLYFSPLTSTILLPKGTQITESDYSGNLSIEFEGNKVGSQIVFYGDNSYDISNGSVTGLCSVSSGVLEDDCVLSFIPMKGFSDAFFINTSNGDRYGFTRESVSPGKVYRIASLNKFIVFEDSKTKAYCVKKWDSDGDGEVSYSEVAGVKNLGSVTGGITSFNELKFFTSLESIEYISQSNGTTIYGSFRMQESLKELCFPPSLKFIGRGTFIYCKALEEISLPPSIEEISNDLFSSDNRQNSLKRIYVYAETPPQVVSITVSFGAGSDTGYTYNKKASTLSNNTKVEAVYVPAGSVDLYKNSSAWSVFSDRIVAME